ncbi:MAG: cysteine desulfurase [bacterium]|jgi:cysteine desulfurase
MYYFDNAATTRPHKLIIPHIQACFEDGFGNPSSVHPVGIKAAQKVTLARKKVARIFRVPTEGVIFCGSGTESDNLAILGTLYHYKPEKIPELNIITTPLEHSAVTNALHSAEKWGCEVRFVEIEPKTGQVNLEHLEELVDENTCLVSIQHVNSETGIIQDLAKINQVIRKKNQKTIFHSDGVQAFSKIPIALKRLGVDLYSISAHKFHGIKGIGALIMTCRIRLLPQIQGGGQEFGLRSGTENVAGIVALAESADLAIKNLEKNQKAVQNFYDWFTQKIQELFPEIKILQFEKKVPHILNLITPYVPGEVLLHHLAQKEIYVSTGSACNAKSKKQSSTFKALELPFEQSMGLIRISFTEKELPESNDEFWSLFSQVMQDLKQLARC